jgi:hypothetical protein
MSQTSLLKHAFGVELWTVVGAVEQFVVKSSDRRARVLLSLEEAESVFAAKLQHARVMRAN